MTDLPAPPVPPDLDLRGFHYMALDVTRLRDSRFALQSTGDEFRAGVLLWCASWHQKPASSLPNDDKQLAALAGYGRDVKAWKRARKGALRGFMLCSDGRLYHPVVAEKALEADARRNLNRTKTAAATAARRKKRDERDVVRDDERHAVHDDHQRKKGQENKENEKETVCNSKAEEVSAEQIRPATTTTMVPKMASQGKNLGKLISIHLPPDWMPDDDLKAKVLAEFGMTYDDISTELSAFRALNVQNGTRSRDWDSTFYLYAKRWKERQARNAPPRTELQRTNGSEARVKRPEEFTEAEWDAIVGLYARTGRWSRDAGPDPMHVGRCKAPLAILRKYNIDPKTGEKCRLPLPAEGGQR